MRGVFRCDGDERKKLDMLSMGICACESAMPFFLDTVGARLVRGRDAYMDRRVRKSQL